MALYLVCMKIGSDDRSSILNIPLLRHGHETDGAHCYVIAIGVAIFSLRFQSEAQSRGEVSCRDAKETCPVAPEIKFRLSFAGREGYVFYRLMEGNEHNMIRYGDKSFAHLLGECVSQERRHQ